MGKFEFSLPYLVLIEANIDTLIEYRKTYIHLKMTIGFFITPINNVHCRQSNADFASCLDKMQNDDANGLK